MWARSVTGELQVVKCSNFSVQKYGKRMSQRKGCDVELLTFECTESAWTKFDICIFADLNNFIKTRVITKSKELKSDLING